MSRVIQETSKESYIEILKTLNERQQVCLEKLEILGEVTANELARQLHEEGITPHFDRNFVHPRLNELVKKELIVVSGKKYDFLTRRKCMTYKIKEN